MFSYLIDELRIVVEENFNYFVTALIILLYILYVRVFNGMEFKAEFDYDQNTKYRGKSLPSFPNGWYVALHSRDLKKGDAIAVDLAGQNMVAFRSSETGEPFILQAYCKHLGANLGIGGKVVNKKCVQCPFHGWLYDGQTGLCVDYNNQPIKGTNCQYNEDLGMKNKTLKWKVKEQQQIKLRKYSVCEMNDYIYVWIHALEEHQSKPLYPMLNVTSITGVMKYRAKTLHNVKSHIQDIPENGADAAHFRFVHPDVIPSLKEGLSYEWKPRWMRGTNPDIASMFEHNLPCVRDLKQRVYKELFLPYPNKQVLSIGYIDNYIKVPYFGYKFMLNITIIQLGCSTVFIFLKSPFLQTVLFHFLQPRQRNFTQVYHQAYTPFWVPYWVSALVTKMDLNQVASDMQVWDTKRFASKIYFKKDDKIDEYLKGWREWYSQYYQGCREKQRKMEW